MKGTFSQTRVVKACQLLALLLGLVFIAGCVTAKIPSGPDVYATKTHPNKPKVAVVKFKDTRVSEKAGSIGLASIAVKKQDLENLVTSYILDCLNHQLDVNVERVSVEPPEEFKANGGSPGVNALLTGKITKLELSSADAAMDPADVVLEGEVWLYDLSGRQLFHEVVTGKYSEWIGFKIVDKATGRLADATARTFAHQLGSRLHDEGALKDLQ
jgi:hypothetical protein